MTPRAKPGTIDRSGYAGFMSLRSLAVQRKRVTRADRIFVDDPERPDGASRSVHFAIIRA